MTDSRAEYERRLHRVLEYIDRELDQRLDLDTLAAVANFSSFHFHRLFSVWMGETLGDYVRRRRLELAAMRLRAQPRAAVLVIALSVGFGSGEAFAHAFRARFGCSPSAWRRQGNPDSNPDQVIGNTNQANVFMSAENPDSLFLQQESLMKIKLVDRKPVSVAYLRYQGPYGPAVSRFWMETVAPWMHLNGLMGQARLGLSHDDPSITAPQQCRYDACVEVEPGFVPAGGGFVTTIPGGRYASLRYRGTGADVGEAWAALLRDWLPSSGLQLDARPCFEYYPRDAAYDPVTGIWECDICVPVCPL